MPSIHLTEVVMQAIYRPNFWGKNEDDTLTPACHQIVAADVTAHKSLGC